MSLRRKNYIAIETFATKSQRLPLLSVQLSWSAALRDHSRVRGHHCAVESGLAIDIADGDNHLLLQSADAAHPGPKLLEGSKTTGR